MKFALLIVLAVYAVVSVVAFAFYASDKKKAKAGAWRVPEKVLLGLGFLGGSIGALLGMQLLRHKTKHWYFWAVNIAGLVWQVGLAVFLLVKMLAK